MSDGLLTSPQVASFVARGFLKFDALVPDSINAQFLKDIGSIDASDTEQLIALSDIAKQKGTIPIVPAGVPLSSAFPHATAIDGILALPEVQGIIASLIGEDPVFDHHFLHLTMPKNFFEKKGWAHASQIMHQDSTIDTRRAFDVQIMYFPHDVTADMGGTRFIPGTHLRKVSESAVGRYQNMLGQKQVVCPAGTILVLHHGIWHGAGVNQSDKPRIMYKIRLAPSHPQIRLWDTSDLRDADDVQRPIFWDELHTNEEAIASILMKPEPWFERDTGRLEYINRIKMWRYLRGDPNLDVDYWLTRVGL